MVTKMKPDGTIVTIKSVSENGHAKNVASFKDMLKGLTDLGPVYQPGNERIQLWNLTLKDELVAKAMDAWSSADRADANTENERSEIFAKLNSYSTRIAGALSSSNNISALALKDAQSILTKIRGTRSAKGKKAIEEAKITGAEQPRTISVSQQSYDQKVAHFTELRKLVASQPNYIPNETDLSLEGVIGYENKLITANNAKIAARSKLIDARNERNLHLYDPETGIVNLSKVIKNYVMSIFTASHVKFKKINGISFRTFKDKASTL